MILGSLRTLPVLALTTAARTLRVLATVNETLAQRLAVPAPPAPSAPPEQPTRRRPQPVVKAAPAPARTGDTATITATGGLTDQSASDAADTPVAGDVDIPALARRTVPEVLDALDRLSTTELGELYLYESDHRRRRTVLNAVEAASAPPTASDEPDDLPPLDVRLPDELVYSTATPRR